MNMRDDDFEDFNDITETDVISDDMDIEETPEVFKKVPMNDQTQKNKRRRLEDLLEAKRLRQELEGYNLNYKSDYSEDDL